MTDRATDAERDARCEQAAALLAAGHNGAAVASMVAADHGISRRQARDYVRAGHALLREALGAEGTDLSAVVLQTIAALQTIGADGATPAAARVGAFKALLAAVQTLQRAETAHEVQTQAIRVSPRAIPRASIRYGKRTRPPF